MIKVGLVDDQAFDLQKLEAVFSQLDDVTVVFSTQQPEEALKQVKQQAVELLVADIEMPGLSGYELADLIHSYALDVVVIFVTANSGYAVHAYELNVHDYIMKPYMKERIWKSIERYRQKKSAQTDDHEQLVIKQKSKIVFVPKQDILFVERTGRSTSIYTATDVHETYQTLNELELELTSRKFFRSHRSFIINVREVKHFDLYTKHTYAVTFRHTKHKAYIAKDKLAEFQSLFF